MKNIFLKLLACLLVAAMLISIAAIPAIADDETAEPEDTAVQTSESDNDDTSDADEPADGGESEAPAGDEENEIAPEGDEEADVEDSEENGESSEEPSGETEGAEEEEENVALITDDEALASCQIAAENDKFILYYDPGVEGDALERIGLYVKESGYIHWVNPINALADKSTNKPALRKNRLSSFAYKYGNATDLITASAFLFSYRESTETDNTKMEVVNGGLKVTYSVKTGKSTVPVYFILEDDDLYVYINTGEIKEKAGYKEDVKEDQEATSDTIILTEVALTPYMSAATIEDEGYMFVPDGSGAIIKLNNGKGAYSDYSQPIYGRDITQVREVEPDMTEQAYLPVMAMVKGNNGLVMIATDGDTFAAANANVSYSKSENSWYNNCYFSFTLRSTDNYYMTGDSSAIMVFEKGDGTIAVDRVGVKYYPITSDEETVTYGEIAKVYQDYLVKEKGLTKKSSVEDTSLYIDFFGGTRKSKSILGIPIALKTAYTTFDQASEIVEKLHDLGVDKMVVNYNDWSEDSMASKIDTGDSVASVLGGKGDYKRMLSTFAANGVDYYATVSGITFKSNGNGFWTLFNTAYRVSKSYSRQYTYNIAYGTPNSGIAPALLSPRSIVKLSDKVTKNLSKYDQGAGLGLVSTTLWSDFSTKYRTNRSVTAQYIIDYYKAAGDSNGKVIADSPNAFLIPYVNRIENLTLQSSQFKVTDLDIPFYQMVLHGYIDYASEAVNGTPDTTVAVLKAIAAGSNIHYDLMYEEASELVNTDYTKLFYCNYAGWLEEAARGYQLVDEILSPVCGETITEYEVEGKVITTTYSNGYTTVVDLANGNITAGGKTYNYAEYVKGGLD